MAAGATAYSVGVYMPVFQNVIPSEGTKKVLMKWRGAFMITQMHQGGCFYRLSSMMTNPAWEVNEKGTRKKLMEMRL